MSASGEHAICGQMLPSCQKSFDECERRIARLEDDDFKQKLWDALSRLQSDVANLNGRLAGYVAVGSVFGAALSFLVQRMIK